MSYKLYKLQTKQGKMAEGPFYPETFPASWRVGVHYVE